MAIVLWEPQRDCQWEDALKDSRRGTKRGRVKRTNRPKHFQSSLHALLKQTMYVLESQLIAYVSLSGGLKIIVQICKYRFLLIAT